MKYFFYAFGIAHLMVSITTLFHSGHDPFFIALSFVLFGGGAICMYVAHAIYKVELAQRYPAHAVPENVPPEEDLDEPAYIRRSYVAYRDAWNNGDERADHVSCTRLVPYTEYKAYYMHNMDECPFRG
ncbi:hypothetical protein [Limnobacter sp.]|uniref:hypothetical protein n=1 Tax=Limnobacter sp. TaxID=2003368 RepID=UPI0025C69591|nr:hypothetical protein [Limnobacter sp.]